MKMLKLKKQGQKSDLSGLSGAYSDLCYCNKKNLLGPTPESNPQLRNNPFFAKFRQFPFGVTQLEQNLFRMLA